MSDPLKPALTLVPPPASATPWRRTSIPLTVAFGPTRSRHVDRALAHARVGEFTELRPGRFEAVFTLHRDPAAFAHAAALCRLARPWPGTEVQADGLPVSALRVQEMGFCASDQLVRHGRCLIPLEGPMPSRCGPCPLFDTDRPALGPTRQPDWFLVRSARGSSRRARRSHLRVVRDEERRPPPTRFTVVFGPSRTFDPRRAVARARAGATWLIERSDGSVQAEFVVGEDPAVSQALRATLQLLLMVRGTEVTKEGLPVSPGQALGWVVRRRPTYVVPPPRDLLSLLADDLAGDEGAPPGAHAEGWEDHRPEK